MKLPKDFREFLESLQRYGVRYAIVGGMAVVRHGYPRFTGDLDVLVDPVRQNAEKLLKALEDFGVASLGLTVEDFTSPRTTVQIGYPPLRIDINTSIDAVPNENVFAHQVVDQDGDLTLRFISKEDLLTNKRAVGRPQDLADVHRLEGKP